MKKLLFLAVVAILLFFVQMIFAKELVKSKKIETEKSILCDDKNPRTVFIATGRVSVLNFPFRPKDVVKISQLFDFKQIKNDLLITAARAGAKSNVVIYLEERRCLFNLVSSNSHGDDLLIVKDAKDSQFDVRF